MNVAHILVTPLQSAKCHHDRVLFISNRYHSNMYVLCDGCCHFFSINTIITRELHYITHLISSMFRRIIYNTITYILKSWCRLSLRIKCEILLSIIPIAHVNTDLMPFVHSRCIFFFSHSIPQLQTAIREEMREKIMKK